MKKAISIFTALTTVLWLSGVAMILPVHAVTFADGDLAREADEFDVYIVKLAGDKKFKRLILNPDVFNMYGHLKWGDIQVVADGTLTDYTTSELVRADGDEKVYKLFPDGDVGTKKWVDSLDCFTSQAYDWDSVYVINTFDRDSYTTASTTMCEEGIVTGDITLSLAIDTPLTGDLPYNAESIPFLKVKVDGSGTISQLVIKRTGAGEAADFNNLYLYEGDVRLTSGRSVSGATDKVTFIGLSVTAPTTISVVADLAGNSDDYTHRNAFSVEAASDVTSDATVGGTFPITGNQLTITNIQGAKLVAVDTGSLADPTVGQQAAEITQFKLTASYENVDIERITLYNAGSMNSQEITNLSMKVLGEEVATATTFGTGDLVTFSFTTPYRISKGENKVFRVYGDLGGEPTETIQIYVEVSADIRGTGSSYGQGAEINITAYDGGTDEYHALTLQGGEITLTFNNPIATDISDDTNDTVMLDFTIVAVSNVEVRKLRFYVGVDADASDDTMVQLQAEIEDVKLKDVDSGLVLMGPTDGSSGVDSEDSDVMGSFAQGEMYFEWTTAFDISAGESKHLQLTLDVAAVTYIAADTEIGALLYSLASTTSPIKYSDTNDYVADADIVPNTSQEGNVMTVQTTSITPSLASLPVGDVDVVKGQTGVTAQAFIFAAGKASDMTLTDLTLSAYISDAGTAFATSTQYDAGVTTDDGGEFYAKNVISKVYLYEDDGTTLIGGPKGFSGGTTYHDVVFDNLSWNVPADSSKKMLVVVDVSTEPTSGDFDFVYFDIDALTDVTAVDGEGTTKNPASGNNLLTEDTPAVAIRKQDGGTLTGIAAPVGIRPNQTFVYQGQEKAFFSKYKFTSTLEAFIVDKLTIECDDTVTDAVLMSKVTVEYPIDAAGTLETKDGYFGSTASVTFSDIDFYVPKDDYAYVNVYADLATFDAVGAKSAFNWDLGFEGGGTTTFHATGVGSSVVIAADNANITDEIGSEMYLYRTFPTFSLDRSTGGTYSSMAAVDKILEFTITNNGDYDLTFPTTASAQLKFHVAGSGDVAAEAVFKLYTADGTEVHVETTTDNVGDGNSSADFATFTSVVTIPEGGSQAFYVQIDSGHSVWDERGDWLQLKLLNEAGVVDWDDGNGIDIDPTYIVDTKGLGIPMSGPVWLIGW